MKRTIMAISVVSLIVLSAVSALAAPPSQPELPGVPDRMDFYHYGQKTGLFWYPQDPVEWSPDGERAVFCTSFYDLDGPSEDTLAIFLYERSTKSLTPLTPTKGPLAYTSPHWLNNQEIIYMHDVRMTMPGYSLGDFPTEIRVMDVGTPRTETTLLREDEFECLFPSRPKGCGISDIEGVEDSKVTFSDGYWPRVFDVETGEISTPKEVIETIATYGVEVSAPVDTIPTASDKPTATPTSEMSWVAWSNYQKGGQVLQVVVEDIANLDNIPVTVYGPDGIELEGVLGNKGHNKEEFSALGAAWYKVVISGVTYEAEVEVKNGHTAIVTFGLREIR